MPRNYNEPKRFRGHRNQTRQSNKQEDITDSLLSQIDAKADEIDEMDKEIEELLGL